MSFSPKQRRNSKIYQTNTTIGTSCTYEIPSFSSKIGIEKNKNARTIYLDSNGQGYNKKYLLTLSQISNAQCPKFPNPKEFKTKEEFENKCYKWKEEMEKHFKGYLLPYPIISTYSYLSKPSIIRKKEAYLFRNPRIIPPIPGNTLAIFDLLSSGSTFDVNQDLPYQTPNRDIVKISDQITLEKQWQSQLIAVEPIPNLYDTYEEFELAFQNWAKVVTHSNIDGKSEFRAIPPAESLNKFLKMDVVEQNENTNITTQSKTSERVLQSQFDWVDVIKTKCEKSNTNSNSDIVYFNKNAMIKQLLSLHRVNPDLNTTAEEPETFQTNYFHIGFDGNQFVDDFKSFGADERSLHSASPLYVNSVLTTSPTAYHELAQFFTDLVNSIQKEHSKHHKHKSILKDRKFKKISLFLNIQFDAKHLDKALLANSSRSLIISFFREFFTPDNFIKYSEIFFKEMRYEKFLRLGFLLPYVVDDTFIDNILKSFLQEDINFTNIVTPESIETNLRFYYFTTHLLVYENYPRRTIFKPENNDGFSLLVTQLYYLDLMLTWSKITYHMQRVIKKNLRVIEYKILHYLQSSSEIRFMIFSKETIENTNLIEMIVEMSCTQILNALISLENKDKIIARFNELSNFEKGRKLLLRIAHNSGGNAIYDFISIKGLYFDRNNPSPFMADIFTILLNNFYDYMKRLKASYDPSVHFLMFNQTEFINPIISASRLICNSNIKVTDKQQLLTYRDFSLVVYKNTKFPFEKRLNALTYFFNVPDTAKELIAKSDFIARLTKSLSKSDNAKEMLAAWKLVNTLNDNTVLIYMMKGPPFLKAITETFPESKNTTLIYEYVNFLLSLWSRRSVSIVSESINSTFLPYGDKDRLGPLACMISKSKERYEKSPLVQKLINKLKIQFISNTDPKLANFVSALMKHLEF